MSQSQPTYLAYLLRLWRDREDGSWRAMLETAHPGEQVVFATLADLIAYLEYRTGERADHSRGPPEDTGEKDR